MTSIDQQNFRRILRLSILLPLVLMAIVAGILLWQIKSLYDAAQKVAHTDEVIAEANHLHRLFVDMETGVRGYLLTADSIFLEPYNRASRDTATSLARLSSLTADNSAQVQRLNEIRQLHEQWVISARQFIALRETSGGSNSTTPSDFELRRRKELMDNTRARINEFTRTEEILRDQRSQTSRNSTRQAVIATIFLTVILGGILAFFSRHQLTSLSKSYTEMLVTTANQTTALRAQAGELEQKAAALQESNKRTVSILESIGDAFIALDKNFNFTYINGQAAMLLARSADELKDKNIWQEFPELRDTVFDAELHRAAADHSVHRFDGAYPTNNKIYETSVYPSDDGLSVYLNDITERRETERAQEQVKAEQARLREEMIRLQQVRLEELAAPLIPLRHGIVLMPLIGSIDTERAAQVLNTLTHGVVEQSARICILDITGVKTVDTQVASALIQAAQVVRLLGAEVVLTGIRSGVAQTLVQLGIDFGNINTRSTLQGGVDFALKQLNAPATAERNGSYTSLETNA